MLKSNIVYVYIWMQISQICIQFHASPYAVSKKSVYKVLYTVYKIVNLRRKTMNYKHLYFDAQTKKVLDDSGLLYVWQKIKSDFVLKDGSKVLSDENYTSTEKNKLAGIEAGAEVNDIAGVQKNGTDLTPDANKKVNVIVPTDTSDLTNNAGFQTASQVQSAINAALADFTSIDFEIVQTLPASGEKGVIYLVPNGDTGSNTYDEYIWIVENDVGRFEKIGSTSVDLSNYYNTSNLLSLTNAEIDTICT